VLIYPPAEPFFIRTTKIFYGLDPPLGLLYLAALLENEGDHVTILDFSAEPYEEQKVTRALNNADAVGITVLSPALEQTKQVITLIKTHQPDLPILIGGPHCTLLPQSVLIELPADICVHGDGEPPLRDLRAALLSSTPPTDIPGVSIRTKTGIHHGPPAQPLQRLDDVPFPARHLVSHYTYGRQFNPGLKPGQFTSMLASRGCPYSCRFCSRASTHQHRYQTRTVENILAELREIHDQGYRHIAFVDDCFPANINHATQLFDRIKNESLDLIISLTATRVDLADPTLYKTMRQAGVAHVQYGLESGNQDILDYYHKHITLDQIRHAVHLSHTTGFFTLGSFILGAPFETQEHFKKTIAFACSLPLDSASFLPLRYMLGSPLWLDAVATGHLLPTDYCVPADKNRGLGQYTTEQLFQRCQQAHRAFYGRPTFAVHLLTHTLRTNDPSFLHAYLSTLFSSLKEFL
jgi:anaerobic magnesium-protoporphyrin IX monomethyl ester cyclase